MASDEQEPRGVILWRKLGRDLVALFSVTLGLLGLVDTTLYMLMGGRRGCIDLSGETLIVSLPLAVAATGLGRAARSKPGTWSGYVGMICVVLSLVVPRVKSPGTQTSANHMSAIASLRTINTAEVAYDGTYRTGYSPSLSSLGPPPAGTNHSLTAAEMIDSILAGKGNASEKSGYRFVYKPGPPDAQGRIVSYSITASPIQPGVTGSIWYFTDQSGMIRFNSTGEALAADKPLLG